MCAVYMFISTCVLSLRLGLDYDLCVVAGLPIKIQFFIFILFIEKNIKKYEFKKLRFDQSKRAKNLNY